MLSSEKTLKIVQETIDSLKNSGLLEKNPKVDENLVLLGTGSPLDSIAFVTFVTEMEDRLSRLTGKEIYLVLSDLQKHSTGASITVDALQKYLAGLAL